MPDALDNRTGRNWTTLGLPERSERWLVDGRGLLSPAGAEWGVDWLIGAPERWHVPAATAAVRQHLVASAPVVETVVPVAGGVVVHRCWAELVGGRARALVEVRNDTTATLAVAIGVRPYGPERLGRIEAVEVTDRVVRVEGVAVLHATVPARHGVARGGGEDAAAVVLSGAAGDPPGCRATSPEGWATAALVWALGGREALRLVLGAGDARVGAGLGELPPSAGADRVAAGWAARAGSAARLELPGGRLSDAVLAVHRRLPLIVTGDDVPRRRAATRVRALVSAGWLDEAGAVLEAWLGAQGRRGRLGRDAADTAASLVALRSWAGAAGRVPPPVALTAVGRAAEHVARRARRLAPGDDELSGLAAGLSSAAELLGAGGEAAAAGQVGAWLAGLAGAPGPVGSVTPAGGPAPAWPAVPIPEPGEGHACLDAVGAALGAFGSGRDPSAPLRWLLDVATPTWTWPGVVDPRFGTGGGGDGDDRDVTAGVWSVARELLVGDTPAPGTPRVSRIALLRWWPPEWTGEALEVHGLPTGAGRVGFALRWHLDRPALLWEVAGDGPEVTVTAPGLDPAWVGGGRSGEALLAEPADPAAQVPDRGSTLRRSWPARRAGPTAGGP